MLIATEARKASVQGRFRKPSTKRSEVVNPTSNNPPTISHSQGMNILSLDARASASLRSRAMAKPRTIGNMIAPPRFLAFLAALLVDLPHGIACFDTLGARRDGRRSTSRRCCFCCRALRCLARARRGSSASMRGRMTPTAIVLLALTGIVMAVLLTAIAAEAVGHNPQPLTKASDHRARWRSPGCSAIRLCAALRASGLHEARRRLSRA